MHTMDVAWPRPNAFIPSSLKPELLTNKPRDQAALLQTVITHPLRRVGLADSLLGWAVTSLSV